MARPLRREGKAIMAVWQRGCGGIAKAKGWNGISVWLQATGYTVGFGTA